MERIEGKQTRTRWGKHVYSNKKIADISGPKARSGTITLMSGNLAETREREKQFEMYRRSVVRIYWVYKFEHQYRKEFAQKGIL